MARQRHPCHIGEMQEHICRCGARYEVTYVQSRFRDRDRQDCEVCGLKMDEWDSPRVPNYKLVERPKISEGDESEARTPSG